MLLLPSYCVMLLLLVLRDVDSRTLAGHHGQNEGSVIRLDDRQKRQQVAELSLFSYRPNIALYTAVYLVSLIVFRPRLEDVSLKKNVYIFL